MPEAGPERRQTGRPACCNKTSQSRRFAHLDPWTVACSPVLNSLPPLCFPHRVCFGSLTSGSFPSSPHLVCDLGCELDEAFGPGYGLPSYKAARFSFLDLPLPASLDLSHELMKRGFHSPARRQGASLLVGLSHSFPLPHSQAPMGPY